MESCPGSRAGAAKLLFLAAMIVVACLTTACGGGGPAKPRITLTAKPLGVGPGGSTTLTWSARNATSCEASGGWSGSRAAGGTEITPALNETTTFTIECDLGDGIRSASVQVPILKPNVVVITTDDQALESLRVMPRTLALIAASGVTFDNGLASSPLCAPSRANFLTGQYSHNHGVHENDRPYGYFALDQTSTLPVWLKAAGYETVHVGKYLNGYGDDEGRRKEVPPGWTDWQTMIHVTVNWMYGYTISANGKLARYGSRDADYQTDVLASRAVESIRRRAAQAKPFLVWITPLAPHMEREKDRNEFFGPRAAPRHEGLFAVEPLPTPASYDEADVTDKPAQIAALGRFAPADTAELTTRYRDALESLQAVDDLVERVIMELDGQGLLANTYVVFTSDNGIFRGEHRIFAGKELLYQEAARVPLLIRGPGLPAGAHAGFVATNVDLAATIVDIAEAAATHPLDGVSLLALLNDPERAARRAVLLESRDASLGKDYWDGLRTERYKYVEWSHPEAATEVELYDLQNDPFELDNLAGNPGYQAIRDGLRDRLSQLENCSGAGCEVTFP